MYKLFILLAIPTIFFSCVKDIKDISNNQLFGIKVDSKKYEDVIFIADNSTRYKFEVETLSGIDIDNDKQITVSVSDGSVASTSSPSSTSSQITLTIQGGRTVFYFVAGKKAQQSALLSITLEDLTQVFNYSIKPSETDDIQIDVSPSNPNFDDDITVTAYLLKNTSTSSIVSTGLKVEFSATKVNSTDVIEPYVSAPIFSNSYHDEQTGFVIARKTITTNKKPGKIIVKALYKGENGNILETTKMVEFRP